MFKWIYRLSDGLFLFGGPYDPSFDEATQGMVKLDRHPKPRVERYDGAGGIRAATAQETVDYDAAIKTQSEQASFDDAKMLKAVAMWTAVRLGVNLATAKAEILTIYRGL